MARKESGTVRPTKRKHVFFAAAVLLLVCVLAAGAVSAVKVSDFQELQGAIKSANQGSGDTTIVVTDNISIGANDAIPAITTNIILTTTAGENRRIYRTAENTSYQSGMFTIQNGGNLTIRGNNSGTLTLDGSKTEVSNNGQTLVWINSGGNFTLNSGGVLTNNNVTGQSASGTEQKNSGAVYVSQGTFTMNGGEISNNIVGNSGGGVYVLGGTFTMNDGEISNNRAGTTKSGGDGSGDGGSGGGVCVNSGGTFTMNSGKIFNNTAGSGNGGGVYLISGSTFTMKDGEISNNIAGSGNGGGVDVRTNSVFTMSGGTITGNTAKGTGQEAYLGNGGGVCVNFDGTFTMFGGTITDNEADTNGTGVYVGDTFNVDITGTADSVYLPQGKVINVISKFTGKISGIVSEDRDIGTNIVSFNSPVQGSPEDREYFQLDKTQMSQLGLKYNSMSGKVLELATIYTVTFETNGGSPTIPNKAVIDGDPVLKPEDPVKEGYTLEGWYNNNVKWDFTQDVVDEDITLTANWTRNTYTVTFEANGGSEVQPQTVNHGETVNKPDDPARDDHTFAGWHEDASFITLWNFATSVTSDLTLYAKWTPNKPDPEPPSGGGSSDGNMENAYRVLFNDGATTLYIVTDLSAGDKLTKPEDPVKDGYTFAGWHKDTACTQAWDFNDGITGSMTLYAKWTPQETVTPTATATQTAEPTGEASPAPTVQPDNNGNNGDTTNGETTTTPGISLPYLIGGILILLLAILLLLFLLLRHTVTFLIPTGGELEEYRIKVWHGRYINTEDLPDLIRTAAWYRDTERQERWDFDQDRVKKSIELYLG